MATYEFKREKTNINRSGAAINGPLPPDGIPPVGSEPVGLKFNKKGETIAEYDLEPGSQYQMTIEGWGDKGGTVAISKRLKGSVGPFAPIDTLTISDPPLGPRTAWGFADRSVSRFIA